MRLPDEGSATREHDGSEGDALRRQAHGLWRLQGAGRRLTLQRGMPHVMTRRIRAFLLFDAAAFVAAVLVHSGVLTQGYEHIQARTAESVIAIVLLAGAGVKLDSPGMDEESRDSRSGIRAVGNARRRLHDHCGRRSANAARHHLPYRHCRGAGLGSRRRCASARPTKSKAVT